MSKQPSKQSDKVRCAVVGMGIGRPNGRALAADPRAAVTALCDIDQAKMEDFAKELPGDAADVRLFTDYHKLCADEAIDAIFVGTPNQLHVPIALEAVKHGKHVLITKPLADSVAAAAQLVEAAEAAGVVNMMSLSTRFGPDFQHLGRRVAAGELGDIYYGRARSIRRSGIPNWSLGFVQAGGGAFRDMGVHVLDAAWWLMGMPQPRSVTGVAGAKFGPRGQGYWDYGTPPDELPKAYAADDYGAGIVRFADGSALHVESFWASHQKDDFQVELFGTEGGLSAHPPTLYHTVNGAPQDTTVRVPQKPGSFERVAAHFIDCIVDGEPCTAPLRHGLIIQQMMEALLESADSGQEVRLDADSTKTAQTEA